MTIKATFAENYLYQLLKNKYHTSDTIRSQIDEIKERIKDKVLTEPLKAFIVKFKGDVIDSSFEKTLKIISKRLFNKGRVNHLSTFKEENYVEVSLIATHTEVESLIKFIMKPHIVLHFKKTIAKDASNMLIIDESEQNLTNDVKPDYIYRNQATEVTSYEKYTGRLGNYLILNGLPLTTEKIGRELRFNKIETKNKVFTSTGLKEIYLNMHFISLILILDLEQHYLKLRIFNSQEKYLKTVEEKIDQMGIFSDIFDLIISEENPLLYNKDLFIDLITLEHIIGNNDWSALPAYTGHVYSAAKKLNGVFKLLEEFGLFLTYAHCIEKFLIKLEKKLFKHKSDFGNEQYNLVANYNELKKLESIANHPLLKDNYQEILNDFSKLLAYIDYLMLRNSKNDNKNYLQNISLQGNKFSSNFISGIKKYMRAFFSPAEGTTTQQMASHQKQQLTSEEEMDAQKIIAKSKEHLQSLTRLKSKSGNDALLEARKSVPLLTSLSDILDQLKKLIVEIEGGKKPTDPLRNILEKTNKFEILYQELKELVNIENTSEQENIRKILADLQKLLYQKPLQKKTCSQILKTINELEDFVIKKNKASLENVKDINTFTQKLNQNEIFKNIIDIKTNIQNIIKIESQIKNTDTFKDESEFFSYSEKELDAFLNEIIDFHEKLKNTCYYKDPKNYSIIEKKLDQLIEEVKGIEKHISAHTRSDKNVVKKVTVFSADYLKNSQLIKKNLEKAILLLQNQIEQMSEFIHTIENYLRQQSFVYSGVSTSVLFDQITYLLSNIDVKLLDMTKLSEDMFKESVGTIFHYQVGEAFTEPRNEDIDALMKEIEKKTVVKTYRI